MPLKLEPDDASRYFELNEAPAAYLDFLGAVAFRAAGAGLRLGVFDALAGGPLPVDIIAAKISADERGIAVLLDALTRFGYLVRVNGRYANSPTADKWLRSDVPGGYATAFSFWHSVITELWTDLDKSIRQGKRSVDFYSWIEQQPSTLHNFQTMLERMACAQSQEVVDLIPIPTTATRLLDIGGGHARYSVAFCQRHPQLTATIVDLPGALAVGRQTVHAAGLTGRIGLQEGNWRSTEYGRNQDVVLMFNILHGNGTQENEELVRAAAAALRPGGTLAILEALSDVPAEAGSLGEAHVRTFSLNLFHTQGGQTYRFADLADWLGKAGFVAARSYVLPSAPTEQIVLATKPLAQRNEGWA